jgi:hypothetical protein
MNRTIVVDLTDRPKDIAPALLGAAKAHNVPAYWGTDAVLLALNPCVAAHRDLEEIVRGTGLVVHVR